VSTHQEQAQSDTLTRMKSPTHTQTCVNRNSSLRVPSLHKKKTPVQTPGDHAALSWRVSTDRDGGKRPRCCTNAVEFAPPRQQYVLAETGRERRTAEEGRQRVPATATRMQQ
jgi:hypothetical protein